MPRRCATSHRSATGSRIPLTFEACVSASTRMRGVSARSKTPTSSSVPVGRTGVATRVTVSPNRAACTSHATLLVGWFWSQTTTSSPVSSGSPLLMMLFASLVLRTSATSSAVTPRAAATFVRDASSRSPNLRRFWDEQSLSISRVSAYTRSATTVGEGQRLAAFIGTRSSRKENWRRISSQRASDMAPSETERVCRPSDSMAAGRTTAPPARSVRSLRRDHGTPMATLHS